MANIDSKYILLAIFYQFISSGIAAIRWYLIMVKLPLPHRISFYFKSYFKGIFFSQALPGSIGGDAYRIFELSQYPNTKVDIINGVVIDRIIGLVGLILLNFVSIYGFETTFPPWLIQIIVITNVIVLIIFMSLFKIDQLHIIENLKFVRYFYHLGKCLRYLYKQWKTLLLHVNISILAHIFTILSIYAVALSVNAQLGLHVFLISIPPIILITMLPITLAGWGVRESSMVTILMLVGAEKEKIFAVSLLYGLILITTAVPGAYLWNRSTKNV